MNIHHRQLSDLIKKYAQPSPENDKAVREFVRMCRVEVMCGTAVTMPDLAGNTYADLATFDKWRTNRFPRLYPSTE